MNEENKNELKPEEKEEEFETVECPDCSGAGYIECDYCGGTGKVDDVECDNCEEGEIECGTCDGLGTIREYKEEEKK